MSTDRHTLSSAQMSGRTVTAPKPWCDLYNDPFGADACTCERRKGERRKADRRVTVTPMSKMLKNYRNWSDRRTTDRRAGDDG